MDKSLLTAIVKDIIVPEVMGIVRDHFFRTNTLPTDEEITAKLQVDADRYIASGEAFLREKGAAITADSDRQE